MKLVSWNVNGIRAVVKKNFFEDFEKMNPDILCLQETKAQPDQVREALFGMDASYEIYANSAEKKGYSSTAIITRETPISVVNDMGIEEHDKEGRIICAEFEEFYLITVYTPNSKGDLSRLGYRTKWDLDFYNYIKDLESKKPVIVCGDLNVAHRDIDLANPKSNYNKSAGFMQEEIDGLNRYVENGLVDTFRHFHPEQTKYSWWSYRAGARARNVGWRIDYFLCSNSLMPQVKTADILNDVMGSDHCPVEITL
jgi:exodeoxyribonuclease-3